MFHLYFPCVTDIVFFCGDANSHEPRDEGTPFIRMHTNLNGIKGMLLSYHLPQVTVKIFSTNVVSTHRQRGGTGGG